MNKKVLIVQILYFLVVLIATILIYSWLWKDDITVYKSYKSFCEDKPDFCYCSFWEGCTFKTQYSSYSQTINGELIDSSAGFSEDTKALCELATKLNDKKTIFDIGC